MSVVRTLSIAAALGLMAAAPAYAGGSHGGWWNPRPRPTPTNPTPPASSSGGTATPVPAPAGLGLFALGLAGIAVGRRGFRRR